jgi:hypothetical protein
VPIRLVKRDAHDFGMQALADFQITVHFFGVARIFAGRDWV